MQPDFLIPFEKAPELNLEAPRRAEVLLWRKAFSAETVGVLFFDLNGRMLRANAAFERMCGYTSEELRQIPDWHVLTAPESQAETERAARELAETGRTAPYRKEMIRKDGTRFWGIFAPSRLSGEGAESQCVEFIIDITKRQHAEDALHESEYRYRALFNAMDEGFCIVEVLFDENGRAVDYIFRETNPAFTQHTGISDIKGRRVREIAPDLERQWFEIYGRIALTGEPARFEMPAIVRGRWFDVYAFRVDAPERRRVAVLFRDITERKKAREGLERAVAERTAALQKSNEQLEAFTYTIAHDLRAPLRAQVSFAQALIEDYGSRLDEAGREYADRIINAARRMDHLVNDLLEVSRISQMDMEMERIDLAALVCAVCDEMQNEIEELQAQIDLVPFSFHVRGHEATLHVAVCNLFLNALKFAKPGTVPQVKIYAEERGNRVRLWVEDKGIGIAPEHHEQIFGVFRQLHPVGQYSGTGVGLAIVQKAVERMEGRVGVESEAGCGSRFWIELQKAPVAPAMPELATREATH